MAELIINATYIKVLDTINELNQNDCYPLNQGIFKILAGKDDEETKEYSYVKTFGTLVSTTSKKICNLTLMLFRYGYIEKFFHYPTEQMYFKITQKGILALDSYNKGSKRKYSKKEQNFQPTILNLKKKWLFINHFFCIKLLNILYILCFLVYHTFAIIGRKIYAFYMV